MCNILVLHFYKDDTKNVLLLIKSLTTAKYCCFKYLTRYNE